jgi:hypothetical protein
VPHLAVRLVRPRQNPLTLEHCFVRLPPDEQRRQVPRIVGLLRTIEEAPVTTRWTPSEEPALLAAAALADVLGSAVQAKSLRRRAGDRGR